MTHESPAQALGEELHRLVVELYPIGRSLTGDGVRQTLTRLRELVPLEIHEVPTGTRVLDWTVPREWNLRRGRIRNARGETIVDTAASNLHVVGYSLPVRKRLPLAELRPHLHALPEHPDWVPYRTAYYAETWGFCLAQRVLDALTEGEYEVEIDATLEDGHLSYGELLLPGACEREVLISTHVCHPSLCNDNLSGIVVATLLARSLAASERRLSYRFVFVPATIGAITWLARNEAAAERIDHGLVIANVGDPGHPTYKRSRDGRAVIDRAVEHVLSHGGKHAVEDFSPYGYDERQYNSPGFALPVGCFMRTPHGRFPEYHTSADDPSFVTPESLADSHARLRAVIEVLEHNRIHRNLSPKGEPQLGRRGLYDSIGGQTLGDDERLALLWVLNLSDGEHDLLAIAERSGLPFGSVHAAAEALTRVGLLAPEGGARDPAG